MNAVVSPSSPLKLAMMQLKVSGSITLSSMAEKSASKSQRDLVDTKRLQANILDTTNLVAAATEEAPLLATEEDPQEAAEDLQEKDTPTEGTEIEIEETDIVQDQEIDIIDHLVTEAIPDPEEDDRYFYYTTTIK